MSKNEMHIPKKCALSAKSFNFFFGKSGINEGKLFFTSTFYKKDCIKSVK